MEEQDNSTIVMVERKENIRETLMKWAGWLFIIFSVYSIVFNVVNFTQFLGVDYNWNEYFAELIQQNPGIDLSSYKTLAIIESAVGIAIGLLYVFFGILFIKNSVVYDDDKFGANKFLWISVIGVFVISLIPGIVGAIACTKKNASVKKNNIARDGAKTGSDEDILAEKISKLWEMKEKGILSEEEFEDLKKKVMEQYKK